VIGKISTNLDDIFVRSPLSNHSFDEDLVDFTQAVTKCQSLPQDDSLRSSNMCLPGLFQTGSELNHSSCPNLVLSSEFVESALSSTIIDRVYADPKPTLDSF